MLQLPSRLLSAMAIVFYGLAQQRTASPAWQPEKGLTANVLGPGAQHVRAVPRPSELQAGWNCVDEEKALTPTKKVKERQQKDGPARTPQRRLGGQVAAKTNSCTAPLEQERFGCGAVIRKRSRKRAGFSLEPQQTRQEALQEAMQSCRGRRHPLASGGELVPPGSSAGALAHGVPWDPQCGHVLKASTDEGHISQPTHNGIKLEGKGKKKKENQQKQHLQSISISLSNTGHRLFQQQAWECTSASVFSIVCVSQVCYCLKGNAKALFGYCTAGEPSSTPARLQQRRQKGNTGITEATRYASKCYQPLLQLLALAKCWNGAWDIQGHLSGSAFEGNGATTARCNRRAEHLGSFRSARRQSRQHNFLNLKTALRKAITPPPAISKHFEPIFQVICYWYAHTHHWLINKFRKTRTGRYIAKASHPHGLVQSQNPRHEHRSPSLTDLLWPKRCRALSPRLPRAHTQQARFLQQLLK